MASVVGAAGRWLSEIMMVDGLISLCQRMLVLPRDSRRSMGSTSSLIRNQLVLNIVICQLLKVKVEIFRAICYETLLDILLTSLAPGKHGAQYLVLILIESRLFTCVQFPQSRPMFTGSKHLVLTAKTWESPQFRKSPRELVRSQQSTCQLFRRFLLLQRCRIED